MDGSIAVVAANISKRAAGSQIAKLKRTTSATRVILAPGTKAHRHCYKKLTH
jgi:hypothetical protein